jgi:acetyl esterase/lipase
MNSKIRHLALASVALAFAAVQCPDAIAQARPEPTFKSVAYGPHPQNTLDLWLARSDRPAPLVVFIHGGGFVSGDKAQASGAAVQRCLAFGVSFASINYRFLNDAPIQDILRDSARAIQFLRLHAKEYNIDPQRIATFGSSAGAGTSLWLATHRDLADPANADPVLRQSTRIAAAGCLDGQATYDLVEWARLIGPWRPEWMRSPNETAEFYHFKSDADFATPEGRRILGDCDMYGLVSAAAAPVFLFCSQPDGEPRDRNHMLHHPRHAQAIKQRYDEVGAEAELFKPAAGGQPGNPIDALGRFLFKHLGVGSASAGRLGAAGIGGDSFYGLAKKRGVLIVSDSLVAAR